MRQGCAFRNPSSERTQHFQVFRFEGGGNTPSQGFGKAFIAIEHGEQVQAFRTGIFEIVNGIGRNHNEVAGVRRDGAFFDVEDHRSAQHEIKLSGVMVGVQWHPIAGIVDFQEQADRFL